MPERSRAELERALHVVEARLRGRIDLETLFTRAQLLDRLGRSEDARQGYVEVLRRDAAHFGALNGLGTILYKAGLTNDATTVYLAAVSKHPENAIAHANFAYMLLRGGDAARAREHYAIALQLEPGNLEAHRGLALALEALGESDAAQEHRAAGFAAAPLTAIPFRGTGQPVRVLLLVVAGSGNLRADEHLDDRIFATTKLVVEYADRVAELPPHDLLFNAVGDADNSSAALDAAEAVLVRTRAPIVNAPAAVRATGRATNAARLRALPDVVAPRIESVEKSALLAADACVRLEAQGWQLPLLLRSPGFHAGSNFARVDRWDDLATVAQALPGTTLFLIAFVDVREPSGEVCKYRVMSVGGRLYPLHLAIAPQWKVHYFSAQMSERADHRAREACFLSDMRGTLGARATAALERVAETLALDYAGIDFSLDAAGRAVVFEANATMVVPVPDADPRWEYRREPVATIRAAVRRMLLTKANRLDAEPNPSG